MNIRSAKAKGRRLCSYVRAKLLEWAPDIDGKDIEVTTSSVTGRDVKLYGKAREVYPYAIECKNQEKVNVWQSYEQACTHVEGDEVPLLVISRNRTPTPLVVVELDHFLKLTR